MLYPITFNTSCISNYQEFDGFPVLSPHWKKLTIHPFLGKWQLS